MSQERKHLGLVIKNLQPLHNLEYKVVFNLHENAFFQKLISKDVLEKVRVRPRDYFKSLMFLDYFSRILNEDYSVCTNLENLSKAIRDNEREEEKKAGLPDKGDTGASYLTLETVVCEAGLFQKEKTINIPKNKKKQNLAPIKKRYASDSSIDLKSPSLRKLDLFYVGIGELVLQQITPNLQKYSAKVSGRADINALVFVDSVLSYRKNNSNLAEIYKNLDAGDYFSASMLALDLLVAEASLENLKSSLEVKHA
jgi:hypothetical protein